MRFGGYRSHRGRNTRGACAELARELVRGLCFLCVVGPWAHGFHGHQWERATPLVRAALPFIRNTTRNSRSAVKTPENRTTTCSHVKTCVRETEKSQKSEI